MNKESKLQITFTIDEYGQPTCISDKEILDIYVDDNKLFYIVLLKK